MSTNILLAASATDSLQIMQQVFQGADDFDISLYNISLEGTYPGDLDKYEAIIVSEGSSEETSLEPVKTVRDAGYSGPVIFLVKPINFTLPWLTKLTQKGVTQIGLTDTEALSGLPELTRSTISTSEGATSTSTRYEKALEAYRASIRATAHAINNFLTTISGRVQIAQFSYLQGGEIPVDKAKHDIEQIGEAASRIQTLVTIMQGLTELNQAWHNSDQAQLDVEQLIEEKIEQTKQSM